MFVYIEGDFVSLFLSYSVMGFCPGGFCPGIFCPGFWIYYYYY